MTGEDPLGEACIYVVKDPVVVGVKSRGGDEITENFLLILTHHHSTVHETTRFGVEAQEVVLLRIHNLHPPTTSPQIIVGHTH